ncbi:MULTISPECIES: hypothetical protein [unclassified Spirosoma]|nr:MULTISPECIES: hypothetical protein [unclassified Spirosoma]MBN8821572.1 hypothetical protein [Spirosoma sp.]
MDELNHSRIAIHLVLHLIAIRIKDDITYSISRLSLQFTIAWISRHYVIA